ncbi:hypothetical protein Tco_0675758 [Tanacetum coccineum]
MVRVNNFVDMDSEVLEGTSKRASDELEKEAKKKQKKDDDEKEAKKKQKKADDDERAKLKMLVEIVPDEEEVAIDRFDREDLETLWKLVKARHGETRPSEGYERVL